MDRGRDDRQRTRLTGKWRASGYALIAGVLLCTGFAYGYLAHRDGLFPVPMISRWRAGESGWQAPGPPGSWNRLSDAALSVDDDRLRAIAYLSGVDPAPERVGILLHDAEAAHAGLNLYTSGHAAEAFLIDMDGRVLHRWARPFESVWPLERLEERPGEFGVEFWRRAHLLEGGDLLAIYEGFGIVRLDRDSNLLWSYPSADPESLLTASGAHHDLDVDERGLIYVLTRAYVDDRIEPGRTILEDFITVLSPNGEVIDSVSLLEAFERSRFEHLLDRIGEQRDIFHTNTLEIFDGTQAHRAPIFAAGNALISVYQLDVVAIVDIGRREVVWAIAGLASKQHQPTLLANGNMLLFDNFHRDRASQVIEIDPLTQQVVWEYPADPSVAFFTACCGSNQRLANGNTLITETNRGRAIEVDPSGRIVWEFLNPHRAGDDDELIASLWEVIRLPVEVTFGWLE